MGQKNHFNTIGVMDYLFGETGDSREIVAGEELDKSVDAYLSGEYTSAFQHLGKASHALQDKYAHFDSIKSPYSILGIKHHVELLDFSMGHWDDPLYDWHYGKGGEIEWFPVATKEENSRWLASKNVTLKLFKEFVERTNWRKGRCP